MDASQGKGAGDDGEDEDDVPIAGAGDDDDDEGSGEGREGGDAFTEVHIAQGASDDWNTTQSSSMAVFFVLLVFSTSALLKRLKQLL